MTIFRYRTREPQEVDGASVDDTMWPDPGPYHSTVTDPPAPDGTDLSTPLVHDAGEIRAATQAEIDAMPAARQADALLEAREGAKDRLRQDVVFRKILRALVAVLVREINTLRDQHGLTQRTLDQAKTAILNEIDSGSVD